jgi:glycerate kinase
MLTATFRFGFLSAVMPVKEKASVNVEIAERHNEKVDDLCKRTGIRKKAVVDFIFRRGLPLVAADLKPFLLATKD